jgi:hypothetical protein
MQVSAELMNRYFANQRSVVSKMEQIVEFMAARTSSAVFEGEQLLFESDDDVESYNTLLDELDRLTATEEQIQSEIAGVRRKARDRVRDLVRTIDK